MEAQLQVQQSEIVREVEPTGPHGGVYDIPIIGGPARSVRGFYDDMRPGPEDPMGVVVGKQVLRYGTVVAAGVAGAGLAAIVAL